MPQRVFVHIGLPKTATTYLQFMMYANREAFARQGVAVVGRHGLHYEAASELAQSPVPRTGKVPAGKWVRMAERVLSADAEVAVISHERYSLCRADGVEKLLDSLPGVEVHVVLTVRDFVAAEPSGWQEYVKNSHNRSWPEHAELMAAEPSRWRARNRLRRVLTVWPAQIPHERIHVITVPGRDAPRELIFERFCSVLGVDPHAMDTMEPPRKNSSLDPAATEMVRRLNLTEPRMSLDTQVREVKDWLAEGVLSKRKGATSPRVEGPLLDLLEAETDWAQEQLASGGFDLVGDVAELRAQRPVDPPPYQIDEALVLDSALEALARMATRSNERAKEVRRLTKQNQALQARVAAAEAAPPPPRWRRALRRLRARLAERG